MRELSAEIIRGEVSRLCREANLRLPDDISCALREAQRTEPWPVAKDTLDVLCDNMCAAKESGLPVCQDTGMACVFLEIGQDVHITGDLYGAINAGVADGYVEGYLRNTAVGTLELARALERAQALAGERGLSLMVWDAFRPQRAVDCFAAWAARPEDGRTKARHYPRVDKSQLFELGYIAYSSGHSRGSTVDLTLLDADGAELDMGTCFDFMDEASHHDSPLVSRECTARRDLLRGIMEQAGFKPYQNEWWHYTLANEPFPDTYFDFPVE